MKYYLTIYSYGEEYLDLVEDNKLMKCFSRESDTADFEPVDSDSLSRELFENYEKFFKVNDDAKLCHKELDEGTATMLLL